MRPENDAATVVKREFRRRGFRRFLVRVGLVIGLVLGGLCGAAIPTKSTYVDALQRQAGVEQYAADAILRKYTSILSYLEGGREAAFLHNDKVDPRAKDLYRDHRRKAAELASEVRAVTGGAQSLPASIVSHPGLAFRAGAEGLGKPDMLDAQVYKQTGAGALAGSLLGWGLAMIVTRRRGARRHARS
ncbi:MAG: hypothetical protein LJE95_02445 [Acidobacteria bacterium]|jgi:hypothetical protein|nr:hypothetical protein [Acidobacteriota bacterium]